jgi:hypothetical protein
VTIPANIEFDKDKPCFVGGVPGAQCEVVRAVKKGFVWNGLRTMVIVTEVFPNGHTGEDQVKFTISPGRNPTGAMQAGPYTITTEQPIGDKFYAIDEETSADSFIALSGTIKNKLTVESYMTFKSTTYNLEVSPEHGIPANGFIEVDLPKGLVFTADQVFSDTREAINKAKMNLWDATRKDRVLIQLLTEHDAKNNPLRFSLLNIRNPRSY